MKRNSSVPGSTLLRRFLMDASGSVAPVVGIGAAVLAGMLALGVDLGRHYNLATEMQSAVDAAALAGATQLDQKDGARSRAVAAIRGTLARNTTLFATDGRGGDIAIAEADIGFLKNRVTREAATGDADANFVEVSLQPGSQRSVEYLFGGLVGTLQGEAGARAVAGLGTAYCRTPPLLICNPREGGGEFDPDALKGHGILLRDAGNGAQLAAGNFGMLALPGASYGVNEWRDAAGRVFPRAQCYGEADQAETRTGQAAAVAQGMNVRFDIYEGNSRGLETDPLYAPAANTVKGLVRAAGASRCTITNNAQGWQKPVPPDDFSGPGDTTVTAMGYPRDNCAYPGGEAGLDCSRAAGPLNRIGSGNWDITRYMQVNHGLDWPYSAEFDPLKAEVDRRRAEFPASPAQPSRYEVYLWELGLLPGSSRRLPQTVAGEKALPVCNTTGINATPERRVVAAAVVNCSEVAGRTDVTPNAWVRLFLTEPMGTFDGNLDFYGEIIGAGDAGGYLDNIARHSVQIYE